MMVSGQDGGAPAELPQAVAAARAAAPGAVLATVLIGSNDLWYVYQNGAVDPTPRAEEDAMVATYRANLERTLTELQAAGAVVVVGPARRPVRAPHRRRHGTAQPAAVRRHRRGGGEDVDAGRGAGPHRRRRSRPRTVRARWTPTTRSGPTRRRMAEDGIHPNAAGYTALAELWMDGVAPLLGA